LKSEYVYTYFSNTLVLAARKNNTEEFFVTFWNTNTDEKYSKSLRQLQQVESFQD